MKEIVLCKRKTTDRKSFFRDACLTWFDIEAARDMTAYSSKETENSFLDRGKLSVKNWKYNLESEGKILRGLINKEETLENVIAVYEQLIICLKVLKTRLTDPDKKEWGYDIEAMIEDLQCACPDLADNTLSYKEEKAHLNNFLTDFYDLFVKVRVWIGV